MASQSPDWWARGIAMGSLALSIVVAARQAFLDLPQVRVNSHSGSQLGTFSGGSQVEIDFLWVSVINVSRRPVVIAQVAVLGKEGLREPEKWVNEFPFPLGDGETKILSLIWDDVRDQVDTPKKGESLVARDATGRWWPRRRRPEVWLRSRASRRRAKRAWRARMRSRGSAKHD
jgi:hypothetical protein